MNLLIGSVTMGLILVPLALGLFVSYRVYQTLDLTTDGSFGVGVAVVAALLVAEAGQAPLAQGEVLGHGLRGAPGFRDGREAGLGEVEGAEQSLEGGRVGVVREEDAHGAAPLARQEVVERVAERRHERPPPQRAAADPQHEQVLEPDGELAGERHGGLRGGGVARQVREPHLAGASPCLESLEGLARDGCHVCQVLRGEAPGTEAAVHVEVESGHRILRGRGARTVAGPIGGTYSSEWFWSKIWRCLKEAPDVFAAAHSWVELADYIPAVLAGVDAPAKVMRCVCAAGHKAMYSDAWGGLPSKEFLGRLDPRLADLRDRLFEKAHAADVRAGTLCREWAERLGLREGTVIAMGAFDAHYGAVGSGVKAGTLVKIIGTSTCDCAVASAKEKVQDVRLPFVNATGGQGGITVFTLNQALFGLVIVGFLLWEPMGLIELWRRLKRYFAAWPFSY